MAEGKVYNKSLNRMMHHGDDYGTLTPFTKIVAATSSEGAIDDLWSLLDKTCDEHDAKATKVIAEVEELKRQGKHDEARQRRERALRPGGELGPCVPPEPKNKEQWRAYKIEVSGFRIILEPEPATVPA